MGDDYITTQSDWITPAEDAFTAAIAVDGTSRVYDLSLAALGTDFVKKPGSVFYVTMSADGNNVYYTTSSAAGKTVDDTAVVAAGAAFAFTTNACDVVFASTKEQVVLDRTQHRYLNIKCASGKTATLRIRASSTLRPADVI